MRLSSRARSGTLPVTLVALGLLALVPALPISARALYVVTIVVVYAIVAVALDLSVGYAGVWSFGHFAWVGMSAYAFVALMAHTSLPGLAAALLALVFVGLVATVTGAASVRLGRLGSGKVTFFLAYLTPVMLAGPLLREWTGSADGLPVPDLRFAGFDISTGIPLFYFGLAILVCVSLGATRYANSRAGWTLRLVKENELVARVLGVNPKRIKLAAFVTSAMFAGAAGIVMAPAIGFLSPEAFGPFESIGVFAMLIVGGLGSIAGGIVGAAFFEIVPELARGVGDSRMLLFAVMLLAAVVLFPQGLYGIAERLAAVVRRRRVTAAPAAPVIEIRRDPAAEWLQLSQSERSGADQPDGSPDVLALHGVTVRFGGVTALDGVGLVVRRGAIHAIIGPNGAGKTTLLNTISGVQPIDAGEIRLNGELLNGLAAEAVARRGVGRTFQHPALVPDLGVIENVQMGRYVRDRRSVVGDLLEGPATRARNRYAERIADATLDLVEFPSGRRRIAASELRLGEQKIVDIARALVGQPEVLLLDEPSAGLDDHEIGTLVRVLHTIRESTGVSVAIIAHHVGFLREVADSVTALDFGQVIGDGDWSSVISGQAVVEAFLGGADHA